jgi:PhnB protein
MVPDCDAVFDRAVAAGARVWRPVAPTPYGMRAGKIRDPYGHNWFIATADEDT